jgi:hypothetical protein
MSGEMLGGKCLWVGGAESDCHPQYLVVVLHRAPMGGVIDGVNPSALLFLKALMTFLLASSAKRV